MSSNQTNEIGQQQMSSTIQSHSRIKTEPSMKSVNINDNANNFQQIAINGKRNKKEQQEQQQSNQISQFNFTAQNQHVQKQKQQEITNENLQSLQIQGIQEGDMNLQNYHQQFQSTTCNNISTSKQNLQNQQINSQKILYRLRSNNSYLSGSQIINQDDISQTQSSSSRFFQPAYDLFFEIQRKLDKDTVQILKNQIPIDKKQEKILQYEAGNIISFIKIIFECILSQNTELKIQQMEQLNSWKINESPPNQQNITSQANLNETCDENSMEITCKYCKEYEQQLQKLEAEIRQHIRVQQLLKLHAENYQNRIEEIERENMKVIEKIETITKEFEDMRNKFKEMKLNEEQMKNKLEDMKKEIQITESQKQQLEKELDKILEKNKGFEFKLGIKQPQSIININTSSIPSHTQQYNQQPYKKTKSILQNKHILDSFIDDGIPLEVDKSSSSKATISSLSTAQPLQRSEEIQKHMIKIDSQKDLINKNNKIRGKKLSWNENEKQNSCDEVNVNTMQDKQNTNKLSQNLSNNCEQFDDKFTINEVVQNQILFNKFQKEQKIDKQNEELFNIQKKLKKLQKISETKLKNTFGSNVSSSNVNNQQENVLLKQLTERNDSTEKYFKPYQFQSSTQRLNVNLCEGSADKHGNKQQDQINTFNSQNQNQKQKSNNCNSQKGQQMQQQVISSNNNYQQISHQNGVSFNGVTKNIQQTNHPSSQVVQKDFNNTSNNNLNMSKISCVAPFQQQNLQAQNVNQQQMQISQNSKKQMVRQNSAFYSCNNNNINNTERQQNSNRTKVSKQNNSSQQFIENNSINICNTSGNISSQVHNLSANNLNQIIQQQFKSPIIQHNSNTISKYGIQHQISQKQFENQQNYLQQQISNRNPQQNISANMNINNYINPSNNFKSFSPTKTFSAKKPNINSNISDNDNVNPQIHQNNNIQNGYQQLHHQKSFEKFKAFMNSPKFKTDDDLQSNLRSQSMDGQSSNNHLINQQNNQKMKNNPSNQNQKRINQNPIKQQISNQYQVNLGHNGNQSQTQLNNHVHNKSHF